MFRLTLLRIPCALLAALLLAACSYHAALPNNIYAYQKEGDKIAAKVLIPADSIAQKRFVFKDYHLSASVQSYKIDLTKGALIAAANALGSVFEQTDVDKAKHAAAYDFVARLTYQIIDPRENSLESVQWLNYAQMPRVQTQVTLTFENPSTGEVIFTAYATRQNRVELNNVTAAAYHTQSNSSATALLPFTAPVYTQQMGQRIKYTLARDLRECLDEIVQTLQTQRAVFTKE